MYFLSKMKIQKLDNSVKTNNILYDLYTIMACYYSF